ncbi:MAG: hypothetical protein C0617_15195 [Desulfuromonas sp.]|uniref:O-antigen ligase family protein n=1 Tax=Desulfuromonas sp. TaxID=892 RepID=UPI000CABBAD3|nr:O-antigen ligase family protein [Desulfuromonas sp.]PLX82005.1 MAG: hypothetical protein C0617_15195 [Desulfuromonas sp.]
MNKVVLCSLFVLVFFIPIENLIVFSTFGTLTRVIGAFAFLVGVISVLIDKRGRPFGPFLFFFIFYILWSMATILWSVDSNMSQIATKSLIQLFLFVWLLWEFAQTENQVLLLFKGYVCGCFVSAIYTLTAYQRHEQTAYSRYSMEGFDPNDIGLIITLGIPLAWYVFKKVEGRIQKAFFFMYVPIAVFAVFLTASRTAFLALLVALFYIIISQENVKLKSKVAFLMLSCFFALVIYQMVPSTNWSRILSIGHEVASGNLNSRMNIWTDGLRVFGGSPVFAALGVGVGAFRFSVEPLFGYPAASHNLFLSILVGQGMVGFLIFMAMVLSLVKKVVGMELLGKRLWIIMLVALFVGGMGLSWDGRKPTWLIFGLIAAHGTVNSKEFKVVTRVTG